MTLNDLFQELKPFRPHPIIVGCNKNAMISNEQFEFRAAQGLKLKHFSNFFTNPLVQILPSRFLRNGLVNFENKPAKVSVEMNRMRQITINPEVVFFLIISGLR